MTHYAVPFDFEELSYERAVALAHDIGFKGNVGDPLLETVVDMLAELERPDEHFDIVQIAGTNGKTSTSRYAAAVLRGEGLKVALYTSPELIEMRERMEIDGAPVEPQVFARGISAAIEAGQRVNAEREKAGEKPYAITPFDLLTVAALIMFAEAQVDVAVLEVGLGGRWDATSATSPKVTCVTGIGLDHVHILGNTLEAIAAEKAAVIKQGQKCVLGVGTSAPASVEQVFLDRAAEVGVEPILLRPERLSDAPGEIEGSSFAEHPERPRASYVITRRPERIGGGLVLDVTTPRKTYKGISAVKPAYQAANIACAITLAETYLGRELNEYYLSDAIGECPTPGRFNVVQGSPLHLIDAAHNPQSIFALLASLDEIEYEVKARPALLCAVLKDKDIATIVNELALVFPKVYVTQTQSPRAYAAKELALDFSCAGGRVAGVFDSVEEACEALKNEPYLATGSITLAGEVAAYHRRNR